MNIGISGEVRCVVSNADGSIKKDTGFQRNLILNQGLDFFGGGKGTSMFTSCLIGSGNSEPTATQTSLDSYVAGATPVDGAVFSEKYDYAPNTENLYKTNRTFKYRFTGLSNVNISEVGLSSLGLGVSDSYLCTRALIKDTLGAPTTITILAGETLDIYYKIWRVTSVLDSDNVVNMVNGKGVTTPYNTKVRISDIGQATPNKSLGAVFYAASPGATYPSSSNIAALTGSPDYNLGYIFTENKETYVNGSYKVVALYNAGLDNANGNIRSLALPTGMGVFQVRFGSVASDSAIPKTNKEVLSIPIEFSWGHYEGVL